MVFMTINEIAQYPWPRYWHHAQAGTEPLECGPQDKRDETPCTHPNTQER
jgi:hypothetical protein